MIGNNRILGMGNAANLASVGKFSLIFLAESSIEFNKEGNI